MGEGYTVADLVANLPCKVIIVSANRLGTINHTLLTVKALQMAAAKELKVVLMGQSKSDASSDSNGPILAYLLKPVHVISLDFLGRKACGSSVLKHVEKKVQKSVAQILA